MCPGVPKLKIPSEYTRALQESHTRILNAVLFAVVKKKKKWKWYEYPLFGGWLHK